MVELSAQNVVMDSFLDTQSRANSLHLFKYVYAYLAQYGQRVSQDAANAARYCQCETDRSGSSGLALAGLEVALR